MAKSPFFQFKQFKVWHDQCGLKVTTEACIFGALVPVLASVSVLDIGTGTGVLALMIAQRNPEAVIDAIEIDRQAATQAQQNVLESPFASRIQVQHTSLQDYTKNASKKHDLIVSNPPFYENYLRSPDAQKNQALHADTLPFRDLVDSAKALLKPEGLFVVLLPPYSTQKFIDTAQTHQLYLQSQIAIYQLAEKPIFRYISVLGTQVIPKISTSTFTIYDQPQRYTKQFSDSLKNFYLKL